MGKRCYLRQNEEDIRDFVKYDGTVSGSLAVQGILPSGWSCSHFVNEDGVCSLSLTNQDRHSNLGEAQTYIVVDRFDALELYDSSSFCFLFIEDGEQAQGGDDSLEFHIMTDSVY